MEMEQSHPQQAEPASTNGAGPVRDGARDHAPLRRGRRGRRRAPRRHLEVAERRADRDHGPVGLGQVDAHAHPRRPRPADGRQRRRSTAPSSTTLNDNELTKLRREHIGFIFQFFNLLPMLTAEENIVLPLSIAGEKPEPAWLAELLEARRPHRPALAPAVRALRRPAAARRDRPRARLQADGRVRRRADRQPRLEDERGDPRAAPRSPSTTYGQTTVMVTHDPRAAAIADRVLFLADGAHRQGPRPRDRARGARGDGGAGAQR